MLLIQFLLMKRKSWEQKMKEKLLCPRQFTALAEFCILWIRGCIWRLQVNVIGLAPSSLLTQLPGSINKFPLAALSLSRFYGAFAMLLADKLPRKTLWTTSVGNTPWKGSKGMGFRGRGLKQPRRSWNLYELLIGNCKRRQRRQRGRNDKVIKVKITCTNFYI